MSSSLLKIATLTTVIAKKFVTQYAVVDTAGELVGVKAHATEAEAVAELGTLKYFAEGLEFAKATSGPDAKPQGLNSKANTVAAYLMYKDQQAAGEEVTVSPEVAQEAPEEQF